MTERAEARAAVRAALGTRAPAGIGVGSRDKELVGAIAKGFAATLRDAGLMMYRGKWRAGEGYNTGSVVDHADSMWLATAPAGPGAAPGDGGPWRRFPAGQREP